MNNYLRFIVYLLSIYVCSMYLILDIASILCLYIYCFIAFTACFYISSHYYYFTVFFCLQDELRINMCAKTLKRHIWFVQFNYDVHVK